MKNLLFLSIFFLPFILNAQINDDFEDGNVDGWLESSNNTWDATTDSPISGTYSLQHVADGGNGEDQISIPFSNISITGGVTTWQFQVKHGYDPSSYNNWAYFLFADADASEMYNGGNVNGYAIGVDFASTDDILYLYKIANGTVNGIITTSINWQNDIGTVTAGIKVTRSDDGDWTVYVDVDGGFDNLVEVGSTNDDTYTTTNYMGAFYEFSSTHVTDFWLDDISLTGPPDEDPPVVNNITATSPQDIEIIFNEDIEQGTAETLSNYFVNNSIGSPDVATLNATNNNIVNLHFATPFESETEYTITVQNIEDISGNVILTTDKNFIWVNIEAILVSALTDTTIDILFTKDVNTTTATDFNNYVIDNSIGNPEIAEIDNLNPKLVHLEFANNFIPEQLYTINISNVTDIYDNVMETKDINFIYYKANPYDIIINEIMPDVNPAPPALPVYEYLEIYNNSNFDINLENWSLTIGDNTHIFPDSVIKAKSYAIICEEQAVSEFLNLGMSIGIMNNSELTITGRRLVIRDKDDNIVEDITYSADWHTDTDHDSGGYSLERIDPTNLCGEEQNWATTTNISMGGTPGSLNSVYASNPDTSKPTVSYVEYISSKELKVYFSENLEKSIAETITNYSIGSINPIYANVSAETTSIINLIFADNFNIGNNTLLIENIEDNCGNIINPYTYDFNYQLLYPQTVEVVSNNQLRIYFSEKVELNSAQTEINYFVNNGIDNPSAALINNADSTIITLLFDNTFTLEQPYTLTISNVKDVNDNIMNSEDIDFVYYVAKPFDIVINEIMCDINPAPVAVPEAFYVELYNTSNFDIDLTDWKFISEGQTDRNFPYITLKSHEYLILCETDERDLFSAYDNVLPLLSSTDIIASGRNLKLISSNNIIIEDISYTSDWYNDEDKDNGGWSLERIDPTNFCGEETNWTACENAYGGTPGMKNSVYNSNQDNTPPDLIDIKIISSNYLILEFSEKISYASGNDTLNFVVNNGINYPYEAMVDAENQQFIHLHFKTQFSDGVENIISVENIKDNCDNIIFPTEFNFIYHLISVENLWVKDENHLKIKFSETIDLTSGTNVNNYIVDNSVGYPIYIARETADSTTVYLEFSNAFPNGENLTITISNVEDINGNSIETIDFPFSYYTPQKSDIVINEVLFHANSGGSDFVELYNRSDKQIDLVNLNIITWDEDEDVVKDIVDLAETNTYFEPKTYLAFTQSKEGVLTFYMSKNQEGIVELSGFPSLDNTSGKVLLTYKDTIIIDEFVYSEDMQFQLLDSETGVSLERINFDKPTQDENNWHSASEYVGFATPAYKNSQFSEGVNPGEEPVNVEPYMFSPNNDGVDDFANINYKFEKPGYVATITIFDAKGRIVKQLANNFLLSTEGTIVWDGLYENNDLAPAGTYLIYFRVFDLDGNVEEYKIPVVSARLF